jgi:hypothetical protein
VEGRHVAVLHGAPRLDVHQVNLAFLRPSQHAAGCELRSVIRSRAFGTPRSSIGRSSTFSEDLRKSRSVSWAPEGGVANQGFLTRESRLFVHSAAEHLAGQHHHHGHARTKADTVSMRCCLPKWAGRSQPRNNWTSKGNFKGIPEHRKTTVVCGFTSESWPSFNY